MQLVTADKMRELERRADAEGNSYAAMMERAGTLTAQAMLDRWPLAGQSVLVLVGPGNNGGDGLVCARVLHDQGARVQLYLWKREPGPEDTNWTLVRERGIAFARAEEDAGLGRLTGLVRESGYIVDAFLGTGVTRPIEGLLAGILQTVKANLHPADSGGRLISPGHPRPPSSPAWTNHSLPVNEVGELGWGPMPKRVVAVDLPSGLNPDTGALDPAALAADLTVTFAFPKVGQYQFPGAAAVGELVVADIGIPRMWAEGILLSVVTAEEIRGLLPPRPADSNKGTFGKVMLACGSIEFTGAPSLAAQAAGRVGAGLVTLALPETIHPIVAAGLYEVTFLPLPDLDGAWSPRAARPFADALTDYTALLVGCGFGRAGSTGDFLARLFGLSPSMRHRPALPSLVVDADALNLLSGVESWWSKAEFAAPPVLTPHPGEMARLAGISTSDVQRDRVGIATRSARAWNAVVVLKGAYTVVAAPDGRAALLPFADAALATAGTGDVLAGTIAGLLAQYRATSIRSGRDDAHTALEDGYRAALAGAYLHGLAGQMAGDEIGRAGVVARDLISRLPAARRRIGGD